MSNSQYDAELLADYVCKANASYLHAQAEIVRMNDPLWRWIQILDDNFAPVEARLVDLMRMRCLAVGEPALRTATYVVTDSAYLNDRDPPFRTSVFHEHSLARGLGMAGERQARALLSLHTRQFTEAVLVVARSSIPTKKGN